MAETKTQLTLESHRAQAQFAYFQLGVAASAIAFAIHETTGMSLANAPWPMGVAVALWATSFALGCFGLDKRQVGVNANIAYLQITGDIPPHAPSSEIARSIDRIRDDVGNHFWSAHRRFKWQMWALFAGALAYIGGHLMTMATIPPKPISSETIQPTRS